MSQLCFGFFSLTLGTCVLLLTDVSLLYSSDDTQETYCSQQRVKKIVNLRLFSLSTYRLFSRLIV